MNWSCGCRCSRVLLSLLRVSAGAAASHPVLVNAACVAVTMAFDLPTNFGWVVIFNIGLPALIMFLVPGNNVMKGV